MSSSLTIGIDVGGTKIAAGVVDDQGRILEQVRRSTPSEDPMLTVQVIGDAAEELLARHPARAVGVGAAAFIDESRSTVLFAPNLAWRDEPLRKKLQERLDMNVVVENDANAAAWAEARFGAGRGHEHMVCLTVGTGIGSGFVLGGRLHRGWSGIGAETGHYRVVPDGRLCGCGNRGCFEQYASGTALVAEARTIASASPERAGRLLELGNGTPDGITGPVVTKAANEGDPAALECFHAIGTWLGQGMADLSAILDPGCYVISGGVIAADEILLEPARAAFAARLTGSGHRPLAVIKAAELGGDAGIVGAADLAREP